mgnify:CR=1 FL=1
MGNYDDYKAAVEALSGGLNTVVFDDLGMPSVKVPVVKRFIKGNIYLWVF